MKDPSSRPPGRATPGPRPASERRRFRPDNELRAERDEDARRWHAHDRESTTAPSAILPATGIARLTSDRYDGPAADPDTIWTPRFTQNESSRRHDDDSRAMNDFSDIAKFVWRRQHGMTIVAEVRANGRGAWSASVWLQSNATLAVRAPKPVESRDAACAKADTQTRQVFDHTCETPACGDWFAFDVSDGGATSEGDPT